MQSALTSHHAAPATGVLAMDSLHCQVKDALFVALDADDQSFLPRFRALTAVLEETFATEESWMEEVDYPAAKSHREQHARVLSGMHHVHCSLLAGDVGVARKVVACLLPDWLKLHVATLDTALAMYLELSGLPQLNNFLSPGQRRT
jgi:hemerythrin